MSYLCAISKKRNNIISFLISRTIYFFPVLFAVVNIAYANDPNNDILKKFISNLNKIEDIQCTINAVQTGSQNPVYFEKRIKMLQVLQETGELSKSEGDALIEPIKKERDENEKSKDFIYKHPTAKWKMLFNGRLYNSVVDEGNGSGVLNYDGNRKITYSSEYKRGTIDNQMRVSDITPDFILTANNIMPLVEFFKIASENNSLKITQKDGLIEMEGILDGEIDLSFGNYPTYYKITVDPARMYMPTAIESSIVSNDEYIIRHTISKIELQEFDKGIWYPVSGEICNYFLMEDPDANIPADNWKLKSFKDNFLITISLSDVKINQGLSKDDFKYEFPKGTHVNIAELQRAYISGGPGDPALEPKPLLDKPLPKFECKNLSAQELKDKSVLICFWDMEQRPSRNCVAELNKKADELKEKNIIVLTIALTNAKQETIVDWFEQNNIILPAGTVETNEEKTRFNWGINALPWLILTDKKHIVQAEGFSLNELDDKIKRSGD